ncbi:MAG: hypothetical protein NZ703_09945, partial [Gemmataceae bacterium]|nr:hypothetical protein [Gemmataceae bacterium]
KLSFNLAGKRPNSFSRVGSTNLRIIVAYGSPYDKQLGQGRPIHSGFARPSSIKWRRDNQMVK